MNVRFLSYLVDEVRKRKGLKKASLYCEPVPKKGTVEIALYFLENDKPMRLDYEIPLSEFSSQYQGDWDMEDAKMVLDKCVDFMKDN